MKNFTAKDIVKLRPCWIEQRIRNLVASYGGSFDVIDVLLCDEISDRDAIWLAARLATPQQACLVAVLLAETALDAEAKVGRTPDPRSFAAVEVAKRYAVGQATDEELKTARDDAWAAYRDANAAAANAAAAAADVAESTAAHATCAAAADVAEIAYIASWKISREVFLQILLNND